MKIQEVNIDQIIPYAKNPRQNDEAIAKVASSLKEFGWRQPIVVDKEMVVIAGHTRLGAATRLGYKKVPIHIATDLTENQIKAYRIADNRVGQEAKWDEDLLSLELKDLQLDGYDLEQTGFNNEELDALLAEAVTEGLVDEDQVPPEPEEATSVLGDVWLLGNHRVMCGDSTSIDAIDELMENQKADMVFTDPPYNVAFNGRSGKFDVILNDNLSSVDFEEFIKNWLQVFYMHKPNSYYICCNWAFYGILQKELNPKTCIVWAKNVFGLGKGYRHQHEFILFDGLIDPSITNESDLWQIKKDSKYQHPTQKPTALAERAINNSTKINNLILDYFGGSGSTLIACEKTNRKARLMELDPIYVDVIVQRWQDFTGKKAIHEKTNKTFDEIKNGSNNIST